MQFDITSNMLEVRRWLDDAQKKQLPFATVQAMTLTAREVKTEEVSVMKRVFDRPTPYTLNALQVKPATRATMIASVAFKEYGGTPAKRFLNPEVHGGPRSQKSHELQIAGLMRASSYLVPARGVPLNQYGNVAGGTIRKVLSQLKVSPNPDANASNSRRSKGKRKAQEFFIAKGKDMVMERKDGQVQPFLVGVRSPNYRKRFPFYETADQVMRARLPVNFEIAFQRAMATSGYKGKWR